MKNVAERTGQIYAEWSSSPSHVRLSHKMLAFGLLLILGVTIYAVTHQHGQGFVIAPAMIAAIGGTLIWTSLSVLECRD
ncbi:MAG: hypothetical protein WDZ93_00050 [Candidatus Paceibacterota bacterium]